MPDFGRWSANGGDPSLNEINRTDRFLDALANQEPVYSTDPSEAELAQLMAGWRDELRTPPLRCCASAVSARWWPVPDQATRFTACTRCCSVSRSPLVATR